MPKPAPHLHLFVSTICRTKEVWSIEDDKGFPAPKTRLGRRAMPFWTTQAAASYIVRNLPAYARFVPRRMTLADFMEEWLPRLHDDGMVVGIEWAGLRAEGLDVDPDALLTTLRKHVTPT
jgi:hypothetical protein